VVTGFRISSHRYLLDRELKSLTRSSRIRPANDRDTSRNDENGWGIESAGQGPDSRIAAGSEIGLENTLKVETRVQTPLGLPGETRDRESQSPQPDLASPFEQATGGE
jgi:hypothetical protein